jgi:hypothetical protein
VVRLLPLCQLRHFFLCRAAEGLSVTRVHLLRLRAVAAAGGILHPRAAALAVGAHRGVVAAVHPEVVAAVHPEAAAEVHLAAEAAVHLLLGAAVVVELRLL